jgi:hypothetical protein
MKKFFLTLCVSTPSVKGIYTALFILILTTTASAQIELKDNTTAVPFHKWEIGFDLKPLFRSDESYNMLAKWHFTERKAVRLGLGTVDYSKTKDTSWITEKKAGTIQYDQYTRNIGKKMNWGIKLGYQYEFKQGKVSIYTASDFEWVRESIDFEVPYQFKGELIDQGAVQPFPGYQSIFLLRSRKTFLNLIQSLGIRYQINSYLSCAFETAIVGQYIKWGYSAFEDPYINPYFTKSTIKGGSESHFIFNPLMGMYLNYHF